MEQSGSPISQNLQQPIVGITPLLSSRENTECSPAELLCFSSLRESRVIKKENRRITSLSCCQVILWKKAKYLGIRDVTPGGSDNSFGFCLTDRIAREIFENIMRSW